jgi:hypothetical protein
LKGEERIGKEGNGNPLLCLDVLVNNEKEEKSRHFFPCLVGSRENIRYHVN